MTWCRELQFFQRFEVAFEISRKTLR